MKAKTPIISESEVVEEASVVAELVAVKSVAKKKFQNDIYNSIVRILIYATAFVLPLLYLPLTSGIVEYNKHILLVVVASVGLLMWLLGIVVTGRITMRWTLMDKGILGILLASIVASAVSLARSQSIFGTSSHLSSSLITVITLSVYYFLAVNTIHDRGRALRNIISLSLLLVLVIGLFQMLAIRILPGSFTHSRVFNTVGSLNALGLLAATCLSLFAKAIGKRSISVAWIGGILGVSACIAILAILNWWVLWAVALVGMLSMIAIDSLNAAQLAKDYRNRFALSRFIVPVIVIVLGAFLLLVNFSIGSLKSKFPVEVTPSYSLSWGVLSNVARQHPFTGYGPENFTYAFDTFAAKDLAQTQFSSAGFFDGTSEMITLLIEGGAVAVLAALLLAWSMIQVVFRFGLMAYNPIERGGSASFAPEASGAFTALVAGTVALFLYPFVLTTLFFWYILVILATLAVSSERAKIVEIEERPFYSLAASLGFIVSLIVILTGAYFVSIRYVADIRYAHAMVQDTSIKKLEGLTGALTMHSSNARYLRDASQVTLSVLREEVGASGATSDTARSDRIQKLIASAVQFAQQATVVQPQESMNWNNLGLVYQSMTGLVDSVEVLAQEAFSKAATLRPGDPQFDNRIGSMWLSRADLIRKVAQSSKSSTAALTTQMNESLKNASDAFQRAIEISPSFGLAIYNLGAVYDRQGKVTEAITQLEKIAPYNANDPTLMFELGLLYVRAGRKDAGLVVMQRAILLAPQYANARWYIALLLEERGDIDGALAQLHEIQKNNTDNQVLAQKINELEAGQRSIPPAKVIDSEPIE